jgi:macrolide-specific efflux system membrane fusion protein
MAVARLLITSWTGKAIIGVVAIAVVGATVIAPRFAAGPPPPQVRTATVSRGNVIQAVSVSGSLNAAAIWKVPFKVTGRVMEVPVKVGQAVTAGQVLGRLDPADLQNAMKQAEVNLLSAQARYEQTLAGATADDIALSKNSVDSAQKSYENAQKNAQTDVDTAQQSLTKVKTSFQTAKTNFSTLTQGVRSDGDGYVSGLATLRAQVKQLQDTLTTLDTDYVRRSGGDKAAAKNALTAADAALASAQVYSTSPLQPAATDYAAATDALLAAVSLFERVTSGDPSASGAEPTSATAAFQTAQTAYQTASSRLTAAFDPSTSYVATSLASAQAAAAAMKDVAMSTDLAALATAITNEQQLATSIKSRLGQATTSLAGLADPIAGSYVSAQTAVQTAKDKAAQTVTSQESALRSAQLSFQKTTATPRSTDIAVAYASVQLAQIALDKARQDLDNATLRAPVDGVVATVANGVGEAPSNPFVTIAVVSSLVLHGTVGEADVAKLRSGQVATVTVDAAGIGTRLTGKVTGLDPVATISQGVPVYGIDVQIDLPDPAIRPGMSGTASVIVASQQGVLTLPNLAIRTVNGQRVVQVQRNGQTEEAQVTFGITNETVTEIKTGLSEGEIVVIPAARAAAATQRPGGPGGPPGFVVR